MRSSDGSSDVCSSDLALSRWDAKFGQPAPLGVNVNLSPMQMARDDVASMFEEALRYSGISGKRMTAELTESAIIADPEKARKLLFALKDLHMPIAMDDFGTGYRSEEHTSELQSLMRIAYAVFCLNKKHKHDATRNR